MGEGKDKYGFDHEWQFILQELLGSIVLLGMRVFCFLVDSLVTVIKFAGKVK